MGSLCLFAAGAFCGLVAGLCCRATRVPARLDDETVDLGAVLAASEAETEVP